MINTGTINNPYQVKAGTIWPWPNVTIPAGWLVCDGSAVSRTTYKALFDVIGTTYGVGDGTTTFNLPNGSIPVGTTAKCKGTNHAFGMTDGTNTKYLGYGSQGLLTGTGTPTVGSGLTGSALALNKMLGIATNVNNSGLVTDLSTGSATTKTIIKF